MKKYLASLIIIFIVGITQILNAQIKKGDWELSLNGDFGSMSASTSGSSSSSSRTFVQISTITGYFVNDNLSIEPEIGILLVESSDPALLGVLNLSYTFSTDKGKVNPFIHAGYGISNAIPFFSTNGPLARISSSGNVSILNFGAGIKFFVSNRVALKTEVNYKKFIYDVDSYGYYSSSSSSVSLSYLHLVLGFSVFL